jgi:phosphate-selective porin OprO/OprP
LTNPTLLAAFQDVWINFRELPWLGHLKIGYFKEPFGLEQQTGEEYLLFMERSLPNAFVPARHMGLMANNDLNEEQTLSWFTGTFREGSGDKTFLEYSNEGDWGTTTRVVWLPYYDAASGGRYLAHVGGAYEFTGANNNNTDGKTFTLIPEINAQIPFSVVTIPCDDFQLYNAEAAIMNGPLLVQAEYMGALLPKLKGPEVFLDGAYVEALYVLTGENHNYNLPGKFIQGVTPYEPFFRVRNGEGNIITGWGAWEIGARLSFIDLNNDGVGGGRAVNYTFGLHWYMTNNCSVMYNFIHSNFNRHGIDSTCDINGIRVEYHF